MLCFYVLVSILSEKPFFVFLTMTTCFILGFVCVFFFFAHLSAVQISWSALWFIKYLQTSLWLFLQADVEAAKRRTLKKEKRTAEKSDTEEMSVKPDRASGLGISSPVDEYDQDTSDEEVRWPTRLCPFFYFFLLRALNKIMQNVYYEVSEMNAELQDIPVLSSECAWSSRWTVVIGPRPVVYFFPFSFPPAFTLYSATRFPRVTNGKTCFKTL